MFASIYYRDAQLRFNDGPKIVADTFVCQYGKFFPFLYSINIKNQAKSM